MENLNPPAEQFDEPPQPEPPAAQEDSAETIEYVGSSDVRKITKADWKSVGAEDHAASQWDASNRKTLQASDFSPEAIAYLRTDSGFKVR